MIIAHKTQTVVDFQSSIHDRDKFIYTAKK